MLSGCGFFRRFLEDTFPGKSGEMFFPQMVLPTKEACLLFYLLGITQPSPKCSVFDVMRTTVGGGGCLMVSF